MSTSSNTTFEFDVNHNGEFKLNPLTYQHGSLLNIYVPQMGFEDMVSYLKWKIPRQFTTLYYMLPPNYALSGMKQIKNDYHTNVMYDIAKVAGKLQIFVAHTPIDLSTVLIPNDGSFEKSLAGVISEETKIKLEESLKYLHQMQKRKNKKFDYYGLWGELGIIRQETQNDYTSDQMVEWAEQEHIQYEETKTSHAISPILTMLSSTTETCLSYTHFFSPLTYYMAYGENENEARQAIVLKLQREIQAEETLAHQLLITMLQWGGSRLRDGVQKVVDEEDSIGKPLYSRFTKTNDFKGVPHPLSGDYTPKPQEEIDDSLYVYGKKGPQKPEISVSDDNSSEHVYLSIKYSEDLVEIPLSTL
ncbi:hypothetical protein Tco_0396543 [Tanacetum coccineum]